MAGSTKTPRKRNQKKPKGAQGTAQTSPKPAPKTGLAKKKGDAQPDVPKPPNKWTAAKNNVNDALLEVFGDTTVFDDGSESDSDEGVSPSSKVTAALAFDKTMLTMYAKYARADAMKLKRDTAEKYFTTAAGSLAKLTERLATTRRLADRIAKIKADAGKVGSGFDLTGPELADAWKKFEAEIDSPNTDSAELQLKIIEDRIAQIPGILATYNQKIAPASVGRIPAGLLTAAGTVSPLVTLTEALKHVPNPVPTVGGLTTLLSRADKPEKVPKLIELAVGAGVALPDVFDRFTIDEDTSDTLRAEHALRTIVNSGQDADFFLTGRGGQRWGDLRFAGERNAPVWDDDHIAPTDVHYGPLDKPTTTLAVIVGRAQAPAPGKKKLAPLQQEDPDNPRYMTKSYGNLGVKGCMVLPYVNDSGHVIKYTEYDIRPYQGTKRGRERVVVGDDGRTYYTADHYKTFQEIR